jgi:hypothetical protein
MITTTKTTPVEFNGVRFEIDHKCIVYKLDELTYFVSDKEIKNLDDLIADNIAKANEAETTR